MSSYTSIPPVDPSPHGTRRKGLLRSLRLRLVPGRRGHGQITHMEFTTAFLSVVSAVLTLVVAVLGFVSYDQSQQKNTAQDQAKTLQAEKSELMKQITDSEQHTPQASGPRDTTLILELGDYTYASTGVALDAPLVGGPSSSNEFDYLKSYDTHQPIIEFESNIKASTALAYVSKMPTKKLCSDAINSAPTKKPITKITEGMYICVQTYAKGMALLKVTQAPTTVDPTMTLQETYWAP